MAPSPRIAVLPAGVRPWVADAVRAAGGTVVEPEQAEALVWTATGFEPGFSPSDLSGTLAGNPGIRWVQLPWAGVEPYAAGGIFDHRHQWTSGKGVYAAPVAEHALAMALAGLRHLKAYGEARTWTAQAGTSLLGGRVTIFGGGGITEALVGLLQPFGTRITVVRKHPAPMPGVDEVIGWDSRDTGGDGRGSDTGGDGRRMDTGGDGRRMDTGGDGRRMDTGGDGRRMDTALSGADAVVLALALTPETTGFFGRAQFDAMQSHAWLVNVARGLHVVTDDLVTALAEQRIGGAALDVTDPEPLPDGHPLWALPNCLITPHTANTYEMALPLLTARITENVRRFAAGEPLIGTVDPDLGY